MINDIIGVGESPILITHIYIIELGFFKKTIYETLICHNSFLTLYFSNMFKKIKNWKKHKYYKKKIKKNREVKWQKEKEKRRGIKIKHSV